MSRRLLLAAALAISVLGTALAAQIAGATHPRPKGASPMRVSLVPAYKQCTTSNRTHGAPLSFPSCGPPVQSSNYLTIGTPDANGAAANSVGYVQVKVKATSPEAVLTSFIISDVRCRPGTAAAVCNTANTTAGPDYSGNLQINATLRISDHNNGPSGTEPATVVDIPFLANIYCTNTADPTIGGLCNDPGPSCVCPPIDYDGLRTVAEFGQLEILDGGPDGQVNTDDNTVFMRQGIFIP